MRFIKNLFTILALFILISAAPAQAFTMNCNPLQSLQNFKLNHEKNQVKKLLNSQVKYANKTDFDKFIATYTPDYTNDDGFDLPTYSALVKDIWDSYSGIKYSIKIKDIKINGNSAIAELTENSSAVLPIDETAYNGELLSTANSIYILKKSDGKWKVSSDQILDETTTMLYGEAKNLNIKLNVPQGINPNTDYTASLEFTPPKDTLAIASLSSDIVEYPQKPAKEVFRPMPDDNILERIFTTNSKGIDEYIIASIGLTQTEICDLSFKLSLRGFGYVIKRVNVLPPEIEETKETKVDDVKN